MLTALFFLATFATIGTLIWAGIQLLQVEEDPLSDRLQELQSNAMVTSAGRTPRRTGKGGFLNWGLFIVSVIPGGEDWIDENEKELNQAGIRNRKAMTRVSEEMQHIYPELANEFYTLVMQVRAGQDRTIAFQQLVRRTGIEDLKSLAAMIIQSERFGTSLAQALKVYADALRTRRRLRAEAAIGKAGIKMLFPIVIFILPVLFVITLVPGLISVLHDMELLGIGKK